MSEAQKSLPASREIAGFTIQKLFLGDYFWLLGQLEKLPKDFAKSLEGIGEVDEFDLIVKIAQYVPQCQDFFLELLARSTGVNSKDPEKLKTRMREIEQTFDLESVVDVLFAIWEINNFKGLWENIKKKTPEKVQAYLAELAKTGKTGSKKS